MKITASLHEQFEITPSEAEILIMRKIAFGSNLDLQAFSDITPDWLRAVLRDIREPLYAALRSIVTRLAANPSHEECVGLIEEARQLKDRLQ